VHGQVRGDHRSGQTLRRVCGRKSTLRMTRKSRAEHGGPSSDRLSHAMYPKLKGPAEVTLVEAHVTVLRRFSSERCPTGAAISVCPSSPLWGGLGVGSAGWRRLSSSRHPGPSNPTPSPIARRRPRKTRLKGEGADRAFSAATKLTETRSRLRLRQASPKPEDRWSEGADMRLDIVAKTFAGSLAHIARSGSSRSAQTPSSPQPKPPPHPAAVPTPMRDKCRPRPVQEPSRCRRRRQVRSS